jgi:hypothetical protein
VVEVLVNVDEPEFGKLTAALGSWHVRRMAIFEGGTQPTQTKFAIEKMTGQLLFREPIDEATPALRYSSTSTAGGHPLTIHLELKAASKAHFLYALTCTGSAPERWENQIDFTRACDRRFAFWCAKLRVVPDEGAWRLASRVALRELIFATRALEDAEAARVENPAAIDAVQQRVLAGLKAGQVFSTANKEGGTRLYFDGAVYRRSDYGDEPNVHVVYADDAAMLECLRRFYAWDSQRDVYPHSKTELEVWDYIFGQLRTP